MSTTIKEVSEKAGVSIATVSHVLNKTRYVSPELTDRVERAVKDIGYAKNSSVSAKTRIGRQSEIVFIVPRMESTVYSALAARLDLAFHEKGYALSVHISGDDFQKEKHILTGALSSRLVAGIILVPVRDRVKWYSKLLRSSVPCVFLERIVDSDEVDSIVFDSGDAIYRGTLHLIKNGHMRIGIVAGNRYRLYADERIKGYKSALAGCGFPYDSKLVFQPARDISIGEQLAQAINMKDPPTAFIASGNNHTLNLLKTLLDMRMEYPKDISVIGFGDDAWCDVITPPLTSLRQNTKVMADTAADILGYKIAGNRRDPGVIQIPVDLVVRESTRVIERGPSGEPVTPPEEIILTPEEILELRSRNYKVGISFHYGLTQWVRLHERAIRDTFDRYGITIASVVEARLDSAMQNVQLDGLIMQKLDAVISFPTDDQKTLGRYRELSKISRLIFIGNVPFGLDSKYYSAAVMVNEHEHGQNIGKLIGNHFAGRESVKIGLIIHGEKHFVTHQRDNAAEQVLVENYANVKIVAKEGIIDYRNADETCRKIMSEHPDIEGLYVTWEVPALDAIRALEVMGRNDVIIATADLDFEIGKYVAQGKIVCGVSAQQPYEQGRAAADATLSALLGKKSGKFIGVRPRVVTSYNIKRVWREIMHIEEPDYLKGD
jgi:ribose transport system substrate-binding protein